MDGTQILTLSLSFKAPWILKDQHLHPIAWNSMPPGLAIGPD